jgi:intracellular multiplication protein IcmJ
MRSGRLIAFPPIEQTDLNRLAIEIYMARMSGEKIQQADACLDMLMSTREITRNHLGTDDPKELARMLHECKTDEERHVVNAKMAGVRLFPLDRRIVQEANLEYNAFMQISAFWCSPSGPYPQNWGGPLPRFERFCETYL